MTLARCLMALSLVLPHVGHSAQRETDAHSAQRETDAISVHTKDWSCIRFHESDDNYRAVGDQYGAYQFTLSTWYWLGFKGYPNLAPPAVQDRAALKLWHWDLRIWGDPWHAWATAPLCGL